MVGYQKDEQVAIAFVVTDMVWDAGMHRTGHTCADCYSPAPHMLEYYCRHAHTFGAETNRRYSWHLWFDGYYLLGVTHARASFACNPCVHVVYRSNGGELYDFPPNPSPPPHHYESRRSHKRWTAYRFQRAALDAASSFAHQFRSSVVKIRQAWWVK